MRTQILYGNQIIPSITRRYRNYLDHAYPAAQLDPLSCSGASFPQCDIPYVTLIDTLDTLHVLNCDDLFVDAVRLLECACFSVVIDSAVKDFDYDVNVSVFETTIRVLGGLLSAHMMLTDNLTILEHYTQNHPNSSATRLSPPRVVYRYRDHLLALAVDFGDRLLPAFQDNDLAYGTINLHSGVPIGVFAVSRGSWVGNAHFQSGGNWLLAAGVRCAVRTHGQSGVHRHGAAVHAPSVRAAEPVRPDGEAPEHQHGDVDGGRRACVTGPQTASCMGRNSDSYYEYLLKTWLLTGKKDRRYKRMYNEAVEGITKHLLKRSPSGLLYTGEGMQGGISDSMGHLACFTGGMLALGVLHGGNRATAERDLANAKALT